MTSLASVDGKNCNVLFDRGSAVSLISKKHFDYLDLKDKIQISECKQILSVDQSTVDVFGEIDVFLQFSNINYPVKLLIVENAVCEIILGRDWLNKNIIEINYKNHIIKLLPPAKNTEQCCTVTNHDFFERFFRIGNTNSTSHRISHFLKCRC